MEYRVADGHVNHNDAVVMGKGLWIKIYGKDDKNVEKIFLSHCSVEELLKMIRQTSPPDTDISARIDNLMQRGYIEYDMNNGGYNLFAYQKIS